MEERHAKLSSSDIMSVQHEIFEEVESCTAANHILSHKGI